MSLVKNNSMHQRGHRVSSGSTKRKNLDPRTLAIREIPLLSNLNEEEAEAIRAGLEIRRYRRGEIIFSSGTRADRLYIVCSGRMKIYKYQADGRELILYLYSAGDFVGGFNLLRADEYRYNASALEDSLICTLSKDKFDEIAIKNPKILLKIVEKGFERVRWAEELVDRLNSPSADLKVAALLLDLMRDFGEGKPDGLLLQLSINREEMGNYTGLSRETVTRKLAQFQDEGLIEMRGNKQILLKDIPALRALAEREI